MAVRRRMGGQGGEVVAFLRGAPADLHPLPLPPPGAQGEGVPDWLDKMATPQELYERIDYPEF